MKRHVLWDPSPLQASLTAYRFQRSKLRSLACHCLRRQQMLDNDSTIYTRRGRGVSYIIVQLNESSLRRSRKRSLPSIGQKRNFKVLAKRWRVPSGRQSHHTFHPTCVQAPPHSFRLHGRSTPWCSAVSDGCRKVMQRNDIRLQYNRPSLCSRAA